MQVEIPGPSAYDTERPFFQGSVNPMLRIFLIVPVVLVIFSGIGSAPCGANDRRIDILRRLDRNKDGRVTTEEIPPSARPIVRRIAESAGLDLSQPLSIETVKQSATGNAKNSDSNQRSPAGVKKDQRSVSKDSQPKTAAFGLSSELKKVPGFDVPIGYVAPEEKYSSSVIRYVARIMERYDRDRNDILDPEEMKRVPWRNDPKKSDLNGDGQMSVVEMYERIARRREKQGGDEKDSSSKPSTFKITLGNNRSDGGDDKGSRSQSSSSSTSKKGSDSSAKIRKYAQSLLKRYDKNKNGVIDKDEWGGMRGDPAKHDLNKDGHLTLDELIIRLNNYNRKKNSSEKSSSSSKNYQSRKGDDSASARSHTGEDKKPYRALTPLERLPTGLPDWFARDDKNGDGQVAMAEFAVAGSKAKADEFAGYDLNHDGVITPSEYLKTKQKPGKR